MDHELLVDTRIQDGRSLTERLNQDGFDVAVAFWARTSEEGLWYLYIASPSIRSKGLAEAFRVVYGALQQLGTGEIPFSSIKIIDADNPIAVSAIKARDRTTARTPIRLPGGTLGNLLVEEAYVYPRLGVMTRKEILHAITSSMNRTGIMSPSSVTLRDGTRLQAVPVGIHFDNTSGVIQIVLHNLATKADQSVAIDEISEIS